MRVLIFGVLVKNAAKSDCR